MKKNLRWSPEELEKLSLHELADLMANIILILRRMPDVPVSDLVSRPADDVAGMVARLRRENTNNEAGELPDWAGEQNQAE
ncbi:hypothetical protein KSF_100880 [Reticulibacter mediterranei]|uniref:Uncharacterized protein n=1 Tax=Reticulibacter mediterranei TaxID=2778369 RepID=A0A8J3IWZ7_9CHLR|nr:hypothetical protein [Reticulibacter mediterranei]GHP00041.1 hypothetical protein KSF_100880 [Reticulibacter mediterranei]